MTTIFADNSFHLTEVEVQDLVDDLVPRAPYRYAVVISQRDSKEAPYENLLTIKTETEAEARFIANTIIENAVGITKEDG